LISFFETEEGRALADVVFEPPSMLARLATLGEVDAALASSYCTLTDAGLSAVGGVSISSYGPVESVRLFSKCQFGDIRTIALDESSLTSNKLVLCVLEEKYGLRPDTKVAAPVLSAMLESADAAVLIGDAGMRASTADLHVMDLGAAWDEMAGLPFVWALWVGRTDLLRPELAAILRSARDYGVKRVDGIAKREAERLQLPESTCLRYLVEIMDYQLNDSHVAGLARFAELCKACNLISDGARLPQFVGEPSPI
jgi:chorismate dehydratase